MSIFSLFRKKKEDATKLEAAPKDNEVVVDEQAVRYSKLWHLIESLIQQILPALNSPEGWSQQSYIDGTPMQVKGVNLSPNILGMFDLVVVARLSNGETHLDFLSKKYAPNELLRQFIKTCTSLIGDDKYGNGWCCQEDVDPLKRGGFCRSWDNINILQTKRADWLSLVIAMRITVQNQIKLYEQK